MPKLVKPKDIDLQNEKACNDLKDRMRMVFMRLTVTNEVKKPEMIKKYGETFTYTEEYIKKFLKRYDCIEYFYILHENDTNELGDIEQPHYLPFFLFVGFVLLWTLCLAFVCCFVFLKRQLLSFLCTNRFRNIRHISSIRIEATYTTLVGT